MQKACKNLVKSNIWRLLNKYQAVMTGVACRQKCQNT